MFPFLELDGDYNEVLVKVFYAGIQGKFPDHQFSYKIADKVVKVDDEIWKTFELFPVDTDTVKITDTKLPADYDFKHALNSMLKRPYPENFVQSSAFPKTVTTGQLVPLARIMQWIVSTII